MTISLLPALLLLLPTLYQIDGVENLPRITHGTVNQKIEVFRDRDAFIMKIKRVAPSPTPTFKRAASVLQSITRRKEDTCVTLAERFCGRLEDDAITCRTVSGVLYTHRLPATYAKLYRSAIHGIPHRWVEFFDPDQGWVAMDPTQPFGKVTTRHVPIGVKALWPGIRITEVTQWD